MPAAASPASSPARGGPHLILFDGECGLCHGLVQFVLARDPDGHFEFASLQSSVAADRLSRFTGLPSSRLSSVHLVTDHRTHHATCLVKARAILFLARHLGWPWRAAVIFAPLPTAWLDAAYDLVARYRHRLFGRRETCLRPRPEFRARFLDAP